MKISVTRKKHLEGNKNKNQFIEMFEFVFDVDFEDIENKRCV